MSYIPRRLRGPRPRRAKYLLEFDSWVTREEAMRIRDEFKQGLLTGGPVLSIGGGVRVKELR